MKKLLLIFSIIVALATVAHAQTLSKEEALAIMDKAWGYLKSGDSISFIGLWHLDDSSSYNRFRPMTKQEVGKEYHLLRMRGTFSEFIKQNKSIDYVEIREDHLVNTDIKYEINACFKTEGTTNCFAFFVAFKNGIWVVRDHTSVTAELPMK